MPIKNDRNQKQRSKSDALAPPFDDRLRYVAEDGSKDVSEGNAAPRFVLARLHVMVKPKMEETLDQPEGGSTNCSCNSVCACVPVISCACNQVCTCNTITVTKVPTPCGCYIITFSPCGG